jgi:hypothetical protein
MGVDESAVQAADASPEDAAAELARLKAENERLKAAADAKTSRRHTGWRWTGAVVLLLIGLVLFAIAIPTVWINRTIMNTDQWVATVGPLSSDPAIQNAVADKVSTALFAKVDVEAEIRSLLPSEVPPALVNFLAPQAAAQIQTYADKLISEVVQSDQFSKVWTETMRATQQAFVAAINGGGPGGKITTTDGVITLYTDQFVTAAQARLAETKVSGLSKFIPWDKVPASFVLYESPGLAQAQTVFGLFNKLVWVLPFFSLLFLGLALWAAPNTRRAWLWVGIGLVIVTFLPFEALVIGKSMFINAAYKTAQIPTDAAQSFWDIVLRFLITMQATAITVGLVIAAIAFFAGPNTLALWFRRGIARGLALARGNASFGTFGEFVTANKSALRIVAVAIGVLIDILSAPLTPGFVIGTAIFVGVLVLLIEFFGQGAPADVALAGAGGGAMAISASAATVEAAPDEVVPADAAEPDATEDEPTEVVDVAAEDTADEEA